jgi:Tol biopolymer transport system component
VALTPGSRLGRYEIQSLRGSGGMGEVYRARDTRLERTVAIKILRGSRPDQQARFAREAKAIATLAHPHICTLFDIGQDNGTSYLVMEYLEGETLAARLERGALPLDQALQTAIEIGEALDRAHRAGIVHRDLKPSNVMLTKAGAKLLDFGLAKLHTSPSLGLTATLTQAPISVEGSLIGTLPYMAPEQLEAQEADARSDLFAFGAVLYEMITGRRAFAGESQASVMAAILEAHPIPIRELQTVAPPALESLVTSCLAKDPEERWQTARDLLRELKRIAQAEVDAGGARADVEGNRKPVMARGTTSRHLAKALAVVLAGALAVTIALTTVPFLRRAPKDAGVYRSSIQPPSGLLAGNPGSRLALSPDGHRLAFIAPDTNGRVFLWVRPLDGLAALPLAGTENARAPFWSPDSRFLGFFAEGKLKRIDASGGLALALCDAAQVSTASGSWSQDDTILFEAGNVLARVSAGGGTPSPVTSLDTAAGETGDHYPFFLPDGRHFLYMASAAIAPRGVYVGSLDSPKRVRLLPGGSNAQYAHGTLFFLRGTTLMAQSFDATRLTLAGAATPIAEPIQLSGYPNLPGVGAFAVSDAGVLVYQADLPDLSRLVWFDRSGKEIEVLGDPTDYADPELSPDGARLAVSILDPSSKSRDIWVYDVSSRHRTRLTFDPANESLLAWSLDGSQVIFNSDRGEGRMALYTKTSSGAGDETLLLADDRQLLWPMSWSPDGQFLLYLTVPSRTVHSELWTLPLVGDRKPRPVDTEFGYGNGHLSSDGRWIVTQSDVSGQPQVYVVPFAPSSHTAGRWQVSTAGGQWPRWRRDGKEIFYLASDHTLMSAAVNGQGSAFQVSNVRPLFGMHPRTGGRYQYDVSPDGQRFIVNTLVHQAESAPMMLVVNWPAVLKQ